MYFVKSDFGCQVSLSSCILLNLIAVTTAFKKSTTEGSCRSLFVDINIVPFLEWLDKANRFLDLYNGLYLSCRHNVLLVLKVRSKSHNGVMQILINLLPILRKNGERLL